MSFVILNKKTSAAAAQAKRAYVKQSDVPSASLDEALRVPQTILDHYAAKPTSPLQLAKALNVDPKGTQIRVLTGAAIAFGLIDGGAQATAISITDLARRILRPKVENDDLAAKREAVLRPRIFGDFLHGPSRVRLALLHILSACKPSCRGRVVPHVIPL